MPTEEQLEKPILRRYEDDIMVFELVDGALKKWDHSEFPHPLVTLDFDADGNLLAIEFVGAVEHSHDD